jgi:hexosaminidase
MNIIPRPARISQSEGSFTLNPSTCLQVSPDARAIGEYLSMVLPFTLKIEEKSDLAPSSNRILITTRGFEPLASREGYRLTISPSEIVLQAAQASGLFYGVQSLRQLLSPTDHSFPSLFIEDWPRFPWRGLMLDVGRHLFPMDFIKRLIDTMALHKFNTLHWHLTDDQGWRIEIKQYPKLTEIGAYRSASPYMAERDRLDGIPYGGFYTQDQVLEVVAYAASRFITVVPEIEMPGHSVAALASYPELGCTGGPYQVRPFWGIEEDVYCAGNDQTFIFLQNILDEVMSLFPGEFIHIGGDECPKNRWQNCPKCQAAIRKNGLKDEHELQSYFVRRIEAYLNQKGRRLIGWDEILEGGLAPKASVMSWRGIQGGIEAARQGHNVVMTPTAFCYFDYYYSEDISQEPPAIGGFVPLEKVYVFEPVPSELNQGEAKLILGAQGNLWTEYISTPELAEYMLHPRAAALSEVVWSPAEGRNYADFLQRLRAFLPLLDDLKVNYRGKI